MDQSTTPLVDALKHCANRPNAAFHTPGHKRGQGITHRHRDLFGNAVFRADLPELPDLDNLFAPEGVILQAQQLAAAAFGAKQTWFLTNGSTCGIEAAILATCGPGDKIIVSRNAHSSVISGLILSGAVPIYVSPPYSREWNMPTGIIEPISIAHQLQAHPDTQAVLIVSPTYEGLSSYVGTIAELAHRNNIPLIVDEAHAPHFAFHPGLPPSALAQGADIAIQSTHKVLSAFTQAAMMHVQGDRIDRQRLSQALQLTQSTSPSYLLLGSLDAARHQMATHGNALLQKTFQLAKRASLALQKLPGIRVLRPSLERPDFHGDCTRLTINVAKLDLTGFEADDILHTQHGVTAELPTLHNLTFIISIGNTARDIERLIHAVTTLCQAYQPLAKATSFSFYSDAMCQLLHQALSNQSESCLSPRQAFFAPKVSLPLQQAMGQICGETICPYPPGIPVLRPGERITAGAIAYLQATLTAGGIITGCSDPKLKTILVVEAC
ncbi:MAG: aminotransferase class I/II-fold pyridoxal phosphate-dependent enzyme [Cyanobacteria bacterium J06621_3]